MTKPTVSEKMSGSPAQQPGVVEMNPERNLEKGGEEKQKGGFKMLMRVFTLSTPFDRAIQIVCAFAAICAGAAMPLMAIVLGRLTANFTNFGSVGNQQSSDAFMEQVQTNVLWFVYLFIAKFVLVYLYTLGFTITGNRMVQTLRLKCLRLILSRSVAHHDEQTPGSLSNVITTHSNAIQTALSDRLGITLQAIAMLVAAFAVAFTEQWKLTFTMMGLVLITLVLIGFVSKSEQTIEGKLLKRYAECTAVAEDALGSIRTVVAFGALHKFITKYDIILKQAEKEAKRKGPIVGLMFSCQYFFMFSGYAISFYLGVYLYNQGDIQDPGSIIAVFFAMLIGLGAIMALGPRMPDFVKATTAAAAVFKVIEEHEDQNEIISRESETDLGACDGHLELRDLCFNYSSRSDHNALSNINLEFKKGTVTAIVGPSGAGKSTLVSLLERWFEPTGGTILLDGHVIDKTSFKWLRRQIALVQQEPQLFNASVYENIAFGLVGTKHENASREQKLKLVHEASRESRAYDFITNMAKGFDTIVGEQGSLISGGQKQRIAIARALIGKRPILLMDEATSALDNENSTVINSLMTSSENRTTIFISHKILTAEQADRIVVLDQGAVTEQGTHTELMLVDGLYRRLYDTQTHLDEDEFIIEPIEKSTSQLITPANETPDSLTNLTDFAEMPQIQKRSFVVNLWTIAAEQRHYWLLFLTGVIACLVAGQVFPVQAILLGYVLESFQKPIKQLTSDAHFWSLMFFVVGLGALAAYAILGFFMTLLGVLLSAFYRMEYFRAIIHQDMHFFDHVSSGALISRLTTDPSNLHELISVNMGLILSVFLSLIGSSIVALAYDWKLALVTIFGALPFVFAAGFLRMKLDSSLAEATAKIFEESTQFASDALSAIRTVKAFTMEETVQSSYEKYLSKNVKNLYRRAATVMVFFALSESVELLAGALAFWYGGKLLSTGQTTTAAFFTVFISVVIGGQAAGALFGFSSNLSKAKLAANNILGVRRQMRKDISARTANENRSPIEDDKDNGAIIDLQRVSFTYPARPEQPVLKELSLQVLRGQFVGIVGKSGSGKSTLIALLERFYEAQFGTLNVFGEPIGSQNIDKYRKKLAYVAQEPVLYKGSLRDNVTLGIDEDQIREEDIVQACRSANLSDFVSTLPEALNTDCGSKGIALSGGQKQRVAIARAIIRNPEILLLDEATSALDAESEELVRNAIDRIQRGRTTIFVTHRLANVRHADIIFVMAGGQVVEQGTHSELMAIQGHYYYMHQSSRVESV